MILTKLGLLLVLTTIALGYQVKMHPPVSNETSLPNCVNDTAEVNCLREFFIFPYQVYSYEIVDENKTSAGIARKRDYLFVKMPTEQLETMLLLNGTLEEQKGLSFLYHKLPEIIHWVSSIEEFVQLKPLSDRPDNTHLYVRNWSRPTKQEGHFFQMRMFTVDINRCLYQIVHRTIQEMAKEDIILDQWLGIATDQPLTPDKRMLEGVKDSSASYDRVRCHSDELFSLVLQDDITDHDQWHVIHDGFHASLLKLQFTEEIFTMSYSRHRGRQVEFKQVFRQPYSQVSLKNITFSSICSVGSDTRVLIGDQNKYIVFSATYKDWRVIEHKENEQKIKDLLFGDNCQVILIEQGGIRTNGNSGSELISINGTIDRVKQLWGQDFMITSDLDWRIYSGNMEEIKQGVSVHKFQLMPSSSFLKEDQLVLRWYEKENPVEPKIISSEEVLLYERNTPIWIDRQNQTSSIFAKSISNYSTLKNSTAYKYQEMSRIVFDHIQQTYSHQIEAMQLPQTFAEFEEILQRQGECQNGVQDGSLLEVSLKEGDWRWCSFAVHPQSYYIAEFILESPVNYKMFVCGSPDTIQPLSSTAQCSLLLQDSPQSTAQKLKFVIHSHRLYRFYVFKTQGQSSSATTAFYFRDIDKQQLQFASTVFFVIMIILTLTLLFLICIVLLRPAFRAFMVYNGWSNDYPEPTYPLSWFNFKIKIKQLTDAGIITYIRHSLADKTDHMVCCFCLEHLQINQRVAQTFCLHQFHPECFHDWLKNEPNLRCPTCRREFTRAALAQYQHA